MAKIRTHFVYPPIPDRSHDWSAVDDNYEGGDPIGWGRTEIAAVQDLIDLTDDDDPRMPDFVAHLRTLSETEVQS